MTEPKRPLDRNLVRILLASIFRPQHSPLDQEVGQLLDQVGILRGHVERIETRVKRIEEHTGLSEALDGIVGTHL